MVSREVLNMSDLPQLPSVELLDRYWAGQCTAQEQESIAAYLATRPYVAARLSRVRGALGIGDVVVPPASGAIDAVMARLHEVPRHAPLPRRPQPQRIWWPTAAASAIAIAIVGAFMLPKFGVNNFGVPSSQPQSQRYTTRIGQRAIVTLADGSRVTLAPLTTMRVRDRTIDLVGEAYFEVVHAAKAPFTVQTGNVTTRVLGTTFDVRKYATDAKTRVSVLDGKVAVGARNERVISRGEVVVADDSMTTVTPDDSDVSTAWKNGRLVFKRTPVAEVLETVQRWYGVRFQLSDSTLVAEHVTTAFDLGSTPEMLRTLALVLDVTMTFSEGTDSLVTLRPRTGLRLQRIQKDRAPSSLTPSREIGR
jgi:transmembrane sensor